MLQRYRVAGITDGSSAIAISKAVEMLQTVERALFDLDTGELAGKAEETAIRYLVSAAGFEVTDRV